MTQMIPIAFNMTAIFIMMVKLHLSNSLFGIILLHISAGIPYNSLMMKSFIGNIPKEIDEAAAIDGCTRSQIITKIKTLFIQALTQKRMSQKSQDEVEIIDSCISGLLFDPCIYWIMSDSPISQEQLIDMISDFLSGGMSKLFTP